MTSISSLVGTLSSLGEAYDLSQWESFSAVVTGSGFAGQERNDIRDLCQLLAISYSGDLIRNHTTHLIVKSESQSGPKIRKARDWQIPIVNLQWILDSAEAGSPLPYDRYLIPDPHKEIENNRQQTNEALALPKRPSSIASNKTNNVTASTNTDSPAIISQHQSSGSEERSPLAADNNITNVAGLLKRMSISPAPRSALLYQTNNKGLDSPMFIDSPVHTSNVSVERCNSKDMSDAKTPSTHGKPKHQSSLAIDGDSSDGTNSQSGSDINQSPQYTPESMGNAHSPMLMSPEIMTNTEEGQPERSAQKPAAQGGLLPVFSFTQQKNKTPPLVNIDNTNNTTSQWTQEEAAVDDDMGNDDDLTQPEVMMAHVQKCIETTPILDFPQRKDYRIVDKTPIREEQQTEQQQPSTVVTVAKEQVATEVQPAALIDETDEQQEETEVQQEEITSLEAPEVGGDSSWNDDSFVPSPPAAEEQEEQPAAADLNSESSIEDVVEPKERQIGGYYPEIKPTSITVLPSKPASCRKTAILQWSDDDDDVIVEQQRASNKKPEIATGLTQIPNPIIAKTKAKPQSVATTSNNKQQQPMQDDNGMLIGKVLLRPPRGTTVKEQHGLSNLKQVTFTEQLTIQDIGVTMSTKDKKIAIRIAPPPDYNDYKSKDNTLADTSEKPGGLVGALQFEATHEPWLAEVQAIYRLPNGHWNVEYSRFYSGSQAERCAIMADKPFVLPPGFVRTNELLKSSLREHCSVVDVYGTCPVRKVKSGTAVLQLRGASGRTHFWRTGVDDEKWTLTTDRSVNDFVLSQ